jgi:hypothetical protein
MAERFYHAHPEIFYDELDGRFHDNRGNTLTTDQWSKYLWHERKINVRTEDDRKFIRSIEKGDELRSKIMGRIIERSLDESPKEGKYDKYVIDVSDEIIRSDPDDPDSVIIDKVKGSLMLDAAAKYIQDKYMKTRVFMYSEALTKDSLRQEKIDHLPIGSYMLREDHKDFGEAQEAMDSYLDNLASIQNDSGYRVYFFGIQFMQIIVKGWSYAT